MFINFCVCPSFPFGFEGGDVEFDCLVIAFLFTLYTVYAMLLSNIISKILSEIHTFENYDFLKPITHSQII